MNFKKIVFAIIAIIDLTNCGGGSNNESTPSSDKSQTVNTIENNNPTVNAGADKTTSINTSITLTGTASDSDGSIVSYEWKKGTEVLGTSATLVYTPTASGIDTLTLSVTDDDGASSSDSISLTVININSEEP